MEKQLPLKWWVAAVLLIIFSIIISYPLYTKDRSEPIRVDEVEKAYKEGRGEKYEDHLGGNDEPTSYELLVEKYYEDDKFYFNNNKDAKINGIKFSRPEMISHSVLEYTNSELIEINEDYLLVLANGGTLYIVDQKSGEKDFIADGVSKATMSDDFIIYAKNGISYTEGYKYNLETRIGSKIFEHEDEYSQTIDIEYDGEGMVYYIRSTYGDPGKTVANIHTLKEYYDKKQPIDLLINNVASEISIRERNIYLLNKITGNVEMWNTGQKIKDIANVNNQELLNGSIQKIEVNEEENWVIQKSSELYTEKGKLNYENVHGVKWLNKSNLLILNGVTLYMHNIDTEKSESIIVGVLEVTNNQNQIYYQRSDREIFKMKFDN